MSGFSRSATLHEEALAVPHGSAVPLSGAAYYSLMDAISDVAAEALPPRGRLLDLAAENGDLGGGLVKQNWDLCAHVVVCSSQKASMDELDKHRLEVHLGMLEICQMDLEERFPEIHADLVIAPGCLSALTSARREEVLSKVRRQIGRQGTLLVIERDAPHDGSLDHCDWAHLLADNGFGRTKKIWSRDGHAAWVARR
jgi:hypothetical protein